MTAHRPPLDCAAAHAARREIPVRSRIADRLHLPSRLPRTRWVPASRRPRAPRRDPRHVLMEGLLDFMCPATRRWPPRCNWPAHTRLPRASSRAVARQGLWCRSIPTPDEPAHLRPLVRAAGAAVLATELVAVRRGALRASATSVRPGHHAERGRRWASASSTTSQWAFVTRSTRTAWSGSR